MGIMTKIFGGAKRPKASAGSSQFRESEAAIDQPKSRGAARRELVQLVLRDTLRKHGIPSDWIECRVLSVLTRQQKAGAHVQFLVAKGDEQLLPYVHAFQESFRAEIEKFDPQAGQWLFSLAWQFNGKAIRTFEPQLDTAAWLKPGDTPPRDAGDRRRPEDEADDLATDLQALHALMSQPAELSSLPAVKPRAHARSRDA